MIDEHMNYDEFTGPWPDYLGPHPDDDRWFEIQEQEFLEGFAEQERKREEDLAFLRGFVEQEQQREEALMRAIEGQAAK